MIDSDLLLGLELDGPIMALMTRESHARPLRVKLKVSLPSIDLLLHCIIDQAAVVAEAISLEPLVLSTAATAALELCLVLGVSPPGYRDIGARISVLCRLPVNLVN